MFDETKQRDRLRLRVIDLRRAYDKGCDLARSKPEFERHEAGLLSVEKWVLEDLELTERGRL